jgi:hypothetical protein
MVKIGGWLRLPTNSIKIEVNYLGGWLRLPTNITTIYNSFSLAAKALNIHPSRIKKYFTQGAKLLRPQKKPYKGRYIFTKIAPQEIQGICWGAGRPGGGSASPLSYRFNLVSYPYSRLRIFPRNSKGALNINSIQSISSSFCEIGV